MSNFAAASAELDNALFDDVLIFEGVPVKIDGAGFVSRTKQPFEVFAGVPLILYLSKFRRGDFERLTFGSYRVTGEAEFQVGAERGAGIGRAVDLLAKINAGLGNRFYPTSSLRTGPMSMSAQEGDGDRMFAVGSIPWELDYQGCHRVIPFDADEDVSGLFNSLDTAWQTAIASAVPLPTEYLNTTADAPPPMPFVGLDIIPGGSEVIETAGARRTIEQAGLLQASIYAEPGVGMGPILPSVDTIIQTITALQCGTVAIEAPSLETIQVEGVVTRLDVTAPFSAQTFATAS